MGRIVVATDSSSVFEEVESALADQETTVERVTRGADVRAAVLASDPDLVVLDLQIGVMGGFASCMDLRLEESGGRLEPQNVLLLLDREADLFLARRSGADGWLVKPLDAGRLRAAATALWAGQGYADPLPAATLR